MSQRVIVKSLNKPNWAGMHRYQKCHDSIIARVNRSGFITGLSKDESRELEQELGLDPGTLSPHSDYWKEYAVTLTDRPLHLNLELAKDRLDYALIKVDPRIANSLNDMYKWPKAEYVVYDQEEDARRENKTIDTEVRAMHDFMELTPDGKRDYLKLLGKASGSMSDAVITNVLFKIVKDTPSEFNRITDMRDRATRIMIYDLLSNKIIKVKGGHYFFDDIALGHGEEAAAAYLDDPHNQDLKISLKGKLSGQTKVSE